MNLILLFLLSSIFVFLLFRSIYVLKQSERVVIYRYGQPVGERGPGLIFLNPFIDTVIRLHLRPIGINIAPQEITTQDQKSVQIRGKIKYRVTHALKSVTQVKSSYHETQKICLGTLREYFSRTPKDKISLEGNSLNQNLKDQINPQTQAFGVEVENLEVKEI